MPSRTVISTPDGDIELRNTSRGRVRLTLLPRRSGMYIPRRSCETSHPAEIELFLSHGTNFAWVCDVISRHEDPESVTGILERQLFAYLEPQQLRGARLLDFGCGNGASTLGLAGLLPECEVIGIELRRPLVELARRLAQSRNRPNAKFELSPSPEALPEGLGAFDFVMLSAVYEHLLPVERKILLPQLWDALKVGGIIFVNQTPHSWFPYEHHSSGLWGVNYLPDRLAHEVVRRFARMNPEINRSADWDTHLRGGLRGGSEREILEILAEAHRGKPVLLQPLPAKHRDRADYWLSGTGPRFMPLKKMIAAGFRQTDRLLATIPSTNLDVAIRKDPL